MANAHDPRRIATNPFKKRGEVAPPSRRTNIQPAGHAHQPRRPNYPKTTNVTKIS